MKHLLNCDQSNLPVSWHRVNTQPEVRLRVGAFDIGVLVFSAAAIFLASVHGKCLRYIEDVDVVFTKKNSLLFILERGWWIRMLCNSSNLHKQKLVKPKPLASKMATVKKVGQKNGEVGLFYSVVIEMSDPCTEWPPCNSTQVISDLLLVSAYY